MKKKKWYELISDTAKYDIGQFGKEISKDEMDQEEWIDDQAVQKKFNISASTLYRLRKNEQIPFVKMGGKCLYPKTLINKILLVKVFTNKKQSNE